MSLPAVLESEVDAKRLIKFCDQRWGQSADPLAYPFDCHRADLFRLCFGVAGQAGLAGRQQNLERVDASGIGGHRDNGYDSPSEAGRRRIGCIVTDDDRRPGLAGLRSADRVQADGDDLAAAHSASQSISGR
jgi:hypothetical protein